MYGNKKKINSFILKKAPNCYLSHYIFDIEKRNYIFFELYFYELPLFSRQMRF